MKFTDLFGQEIRVGDFVAHATKCTDSAHLRRSLITSIETVLCRWDKNTSEFRVRLKSITPHIDQPKWGYVNEGGKKTYTKLGAHDYIAIGSSTIVSRFNNEQVPEVITLNGVILLGSTPKAAFTEREIEALTKCKTKLKP